MIRAAVLTVVIETSLFFLMGYRSKRFLAVAALSNLLTNVTLNLALLVTALLCEWQGLPGLFIYVVISVGEVGAVAVEYIIYDKFIRNNEPYSNTGITNAAGTAGAKRKAPRSRVLFLQVLFTNAVSFSTGYLLAHFGVGGFGSGIM